MLWKEFQPPSENMTLNLSFLTRRSEKISIKILFRDPVKNPATFHSWWQWSERLRVSNWPWSTLLKIVGKEFMKGDQRSSWRIFSHHHYWVKSFWAAVSNWTRCCHCMVHVVGWELWCTEPHSSYCTSWVKKKSKSRHYFDFIFSSENLVGQVL